MAEKARPAEAGQDVGVARGSGQRHDGIVGTAGGITRTADLTEARRLFNQGFKLCKLMPNLKRPEGDGWNMNPVKHFDEAATGYGVLLAANGLCSIDPDNEPLARRMLSGLGFDLEALLAAGVRSISTRPGSGGRSAFRVADGLRWVKFSFKGTGTVLELRATAANLQDVVPGLVYADSLGELRTQHYASDARLDEAPELPATFLAWWHRLSNDLEFLREQQAKAGAILDIKPQLSISGGNGDKSLAFKSAMRVPFNEVHMVEDILLRHGYAQAGERFAPPTATGKPGVREINGKDGLWQSDHASDPLFGTFDAWTAFVVLDHDGDIAAAESAARATYDASVMADFFDVSDISDLLGDPPPRRKFEVIPAGAFAAGKPPSWIVRGVLPEAELVVIYGESGSGKSFFALDLVASVARGIEWRGNKVKQGRVVYVAAEGAGGFRKRLSAYAKHHAIALDKLALGIIPAAPNLLTDDDKHVADAILAASGASIIVIDTLAQATPGANENAGEDMGKVLARCKRLHGATGAVVVLIHHSGKDATRGARGWSGIRAAVDAEIEITRLADARTARVSKQKDGDDGAAFAFRLLSIELGADDEGEPITSCVVEHQGEPPPVTREPGGVVQRTVYRCALDLLATGDDTVKTKAVIDAAVGKLVFDPGKRDKRREHATRAISGLVEGGFFTIDGENITLPQVARASS